MTKALFVIVPLIGLAALGLATGNAQVNPNVEEGLHPYGSYKGGDIDAVSLSNGGLSVSIPLWSTPQRGTLKEDYVWVYNSKLWSACN